MMMEFIIQNHVFEWILFQNKEPETNGMNEFEFSFSALFDSFSLLFVPLPVCG